MSSERHPVPPIPVDARVEHGTSTRRPAPAGNLVRCLPGQSLADMRTLLSGAWRCVVIEVGQSVAVLAATGSPTQEMRPAAPRRIGRLGGEEAIWAMSSEYAHRNATATAPAPPRPQ